MKTASLLLAVFVAAAASLAEAEEAKKPLVYVPVLPYEWLFERVAGDWIEVESIVGVGDDCHEYSPTPKQLTRIAKSNLIFSGELGFEGNFFVKLGEGIDAPKEIDLLEGVELLEGSCGLCDSHANAEGEEGHDEHHHHDHDHDHEDLHDPHVWLSPAILVQQAERVAEILKPFTAPEAATAMDANVASLKAELEAVDAEIKAALEPMKGEIFYVYHGAFAYFAEAYGLTQKAIEIVGRRPTPKQLTEIAESAKEDEVKTIFVQPQFDQSSATSLAETIGGTVAELDPLDKDVIANLRKITEAILASR